MWGVNDSRKCVYVCSTIPPVFWDTHPNCAPQGKCSHGGYSGAAPDVDTA